MTGPGVSLFWRWLPLPSLLMQNHSTLLKLECAQQSPRTTWKFGFWFAMSSAMSSAMAWDRKWQAFGCYLGLWSLGYICVQNDRHAVGLQTRLRFPVWVNWVFSATFQWLDSPLLHFAPCVHKDHSANGNRAITTEGESTRDIWRKGKTFAAASRNYKSFRRDGVWSWLLRKGTLPRVEG